MFNCLPGAMLEKGHTQGVVSTLDKFPGIC